MRGRQTSRDLTAELDHGLARGRHDNTRKAEANPEKGFTQGGNAAATVTTNSVPTHTHNGARETLVGY